MEADTPVAAEPGQDPPEQGQGGTECEAPDVLYKGAHRWAELTAPCGSLNKGRQNKLLL